MLPVSSRRSVAVLRLQAVVDRREHLLPGLEIAERLGGRNRRRIPEVQQFNARCVVSAVKAVRGREEK